MGPPRDHHFIPQFYLKQWCINGKIVEYSIKNTKLIAKRVGTKGTGFQADLYSFPELPPVQAQHIEKVFLQYLDDTASRALNLHLTSNRKGWTPELINGWSRFMLGLHTRHPDAMKEFRAALKAIWVKSGPPSQQEYELTKKTTDPATFDEYIAAIDPLIPVKAQVNAIIRAIDNEFVINKFNGMYQTVVNLSNSRHHLLTSDRPLALLDLKEKHGILYLPISPTLLFFASNDQDAAYRLVKLPPSDIATKVNTFVVERARRYVWSDTDSQTTFIKRRMSTKLEPTPIFGDLDAYPPLPLPAPLDRQR
jgi:hypothetical protein